MFRPTNGALAVLWVNCPFPWKSRRGVMATLETDVAAPSLFARFDVEELKHKFQGGVPVPNMCIDNFLEPAFAEEVAASFPTFEDSRKVGKEFAGVNEKKKVQVTE